MKRAVAITQPARLFLEQKQLCIKGESREMTVPVTDLGVIVVDNDAVQVTAPLMGALGEAGVAILFCGSDHLPVSLTLPLSGHSLQPKYLRQQFEASRPIQKRLWQQIIFAKICAQARHLAQQTGQDGNLFALAKLVKTGDATNREAVAASVYFESLFGSSFLRLRKAASLEAADDTQVLINACLNYGYAVLRALVARSICLTGLHPSLGIHHKHRENTFSLAADLMEPLRPLVDRICYDTLKAMEEPGRNLTPTLKRQMLALLTAEVDWKGERWPIEAAVEDYAIAFRECLFGNQQKLLIPIV